MTYFYFITNSKWTCFYCKIWNHSWRARRILKSAFVIFPYLWLCSIKSILLMKIFKGRAYMIFNLWLMSIYPRFPSIRYIYVETWFLNLSDKPLALSESNNCNITELTVQKRRWSVPQGTTSPTSYLWQRIVLL